MIPTKLNGPSDFRLFIRQRGSKAKVVTPKRACVLESAIPRKELARDGKVTLRIMEYANTLQEVTMKQAAAGIQEVFGETALSQACR